MQANENTLHTSNRLQTGFPSERLLPWLPIELSINQNFSKSITPIGLVDSDADISIVNGEIGKALGFDIKSGTLTTIHGVGGGKTKGYIHEVWHKIRGRYKDEKPIIFQGKLVFIEDEFPHTSPQQTAIWGRLDVFLNSCVSFHEKEKDFDITGLYN